jgi:RES domain
VESRAAQVAQAPVISVTGDWQRHVAARDSDLALNGRIGRARWGTKPGFPVLYLGKPTESIVVEAYRHLVDPLDADVPPTALAPRVLVTARVSVTNVVDLRTARGRSQVGLVQGDLVSPTDDREAYARCQGVAQIAHQLGRHGIIAPAATGMGETVALFMDLLPASERPERAEDDVMWATLPPDPRKRGTRHLSVVRST